MTFHVQNKHSDPHPPDTPALIYAAVMIVVYIVAMIWAR